MPKWTGTLTSDDGNVMQVTGVQVGVEQPPVTPTGPVFPAGANMVTINTLNYPLAAIDPPTSDPAKPGGRDTDQLIIVTKSTAPPRNRYGNEVGVKGGKIVALGTNLSLTVLPLSGPGITLDYVLSGHGTAADFLRKAKLGDDVLVNTVTTPPVIVTPPATVGRQVMGAYLMIGTGKVPQLDGRCNRAVVAFYQGTDLVDWNGGANETNGLTAWRAKGGRDVLVSLGGQGGTVVLDQIDEGIEKINRTRFPVDGIDFDNEAFSLTTAQVVSILDATVQRLGRKPGDFIAQFVPPGGPPVAKALATAKAVQQLGYRVYFGQQLYETSISDSDVMNATAQAVGVLGAPSVLVGMMLGDSHGSWTVASAMSRMAAVIARWPDIGGAYVWESSREGTSMVINGVGLLLGVPSP